MNSIVIRGSVSFACLATLFCGPNLQAQNKETSQKPLVRIKTDLETGASSIVGQRIRLIVDVLDSQGWANVPKLPEINVPGAIVYLPPGQSARLNESVDGQSYTGQRNEWWIYPQRSGTLTVPDLAFNVQVKSFDSKSASEIQIVDTESLDIDVRLPEGVSDASRLIVTEQLDVSQSWNPNASEFSVGDGITRKITRKVSGAPVLVLSDISTSESPGVKLYWKEPDSSETNIRGELTATRVDQVTYVFSVGGTIELPSIEIQWWNTKNAKLETETLAGQVIQVASETSALAPDPLPDESAKAPVLRSIGQTWLAGSVGLVIVFAVAYCVIRRCKPFLLCHAKFWPATRLPPLNP